MSDLPVAPSSAAETHSALDAVQQIAFAALTSGATIRQAASKAGIHRNTVTRWLHSDAAFRAAYNAWRQEMISSTRTRVLGMANAAATAVLNAIEMGDARIALTLLRDLGMTRPAKPGQTEQQLVREQIEIALEKVDARIAEARERADRSVRDRNQLRARIGPRAALPAPPAAAPIAPASDAAPEERTGTQVVS